MLKIELIAVGHKVPVWLLEGIEEYATRMQKECNFSITEIRTAARRNKPIDLLKKEEGKALVASLSSSAHVVAMDKDGENWSTEQIAGKFQLWSSETNHFQFLIGGPDGLSSACLNKASEVCSLSNLTFPHFLVRLLIVEQIYRALKINVGHPYHK